MVSSVSLEYFKILFLKPRTLDTLTPYLNSFPYTTLTVFQGLPQRDTREQLTD